MNDIQEYCGKIYSEIYTGLIGNDSEAFAQKEAIRAALTETMKKFPDTDTAEIWHAVYSVHVHRKSGIIDTDTIARVISADQSWKKSSGHAFEEMIKSLASSALKNDGRKFCYGCIQSKTSIRDKVTRDREPSLQAMRSFFWSVIIVLDGDFLRLPKFITLSQRQWFNETWRADIS